MAELTPKNSGRTPNWNSWRSPVTLGVFILLASAGVWLLANAQSALANL